jgi:putative ABC transport system permease protein
LVPLDFTDLLLVLGLAVATMALSAYWRLGIVRQLAGSGLRAIAQLAVVGYVFAVVFDPAGIHPLLTIAVILAMISLVAVVVRNRIGRTIPRLFLWVWGSVLVGTGAISLYLVAIVIQPDPIYSPQYWVPVAAAILAGSLNAAMVAGEQLVKTLNACQIEIETHLSLGATPEQAIASYRRDAVRAGLTPTLNAMAIAGAVTLPGILTGQLLAGIEPLDAVSYQILILFAVVLADLLTTWLLTGGICRQFFNADLQLRHF